MPATSSKVTGWLWSGAISRARLLPKPMPVRPPPAPVVPLRMKKNHSPMISRKGSQLSTCTRKEPDSAGTTSTLA